MVSVPQSVVSVGISSMDIPGPDVSLDKDDDELDLEPTTEDDKHDDGHMEDILDQICSIAEKQKYPCNLDSLISVVSQGTVGFSYSDDLHIHNSHCSWKQYYPVVTFLMNGHLRAQYERLSGALGFPACSPEQWHRILKKLEVHVSDLAKWSCDQVRQDVKSRGDTKEWIAAYDGFYLT